MAMGFYKRIINGLTFVNFRSLITGTFDRAVSSEGRGHRFDSCRVHQFSLLCFLFYCRARTLAPVVRSVEVTAFGDEAGGAELLVFVALGLSGAPA